MRTSIILIPLLILFCSAHAKKNDTLKPWVYSTVPRANGQIAFTKSFPLAQGTSDRKIAGAFKMAASKKVWGFRADTANQTIPGSITGKGSVNFKRPFHLNIWQDKAYCNYLLTYDTDSIRITLTDFVFKEKYSNRRKAEQTLNIKLIDRRLLRGNKNAHTFYNYFHSAVDMFYEDFTGQLNKNKSPE